MHPLPMGELAATPWSFSPFWLIALALGVPALLWLVLAWRRALLECPNRVRRAGVREMRRLLKSLQRTDSPPRPAQLHAWQRATARVWDVRTSAPCVNEILQAAHSLSGDASVIPRWRDVWQRTEHGLYGPNLQPPSEWVQDVSNIAATVDMPKRERFFPNRLAHWLPSMACAVLLAAIFGSAPVQADVPWSAPDIAAPEVRSEEIATEVADDTQGAPEMPSEELAAEVEDVAEAALAANWNDWAAHRNLAVYQTQQGELFPAIAHATAAFVQHPTGSDTRDALITALGETEMVDRNLQRLLSGRWYERAPALLSPASWQRLALLAAFVAAAGLCVMICSLYSLGTPLLSRNALQWTGRGIAALGTLVLVTALLSWNAYGAFAHPEAAMLVQNANVGPIPTDLVSMEETSPLSAGSVVIAGRSFLGWRQVEAEREISGWVRGNTLMPLYAAHR